MNFGRHVMPALWLGLVPSLACSAHAPNHAPCSTAYDLQNDANSPCAPSRPDGIYPVGYPTDNDGSPTLPRRTETCISRPETAGREVKTAIEGCDRGKLWNAILGYEEFSSFVKVPLSQNTYAQLIKECLAMHLQGICEESPVRDGEDRTYAPMENRPHLGDPKVQKVIAVPGGGEWKHPFTLVAMSLFDLNQTPPKPRPSIMLVEFGGDWWILPKTPR